MQLLETAEYYEGPKYVGTSSRYWYGMQLSLISPKCFRVARRGGATPSLLEADNSNTKPTICRRPVNSHELRVGQLHVW